MTSTRFRAAGDTHPGLLRENNEDRFFFDDRRGLYCVIDGVGGHLAGERAAEIAADTLRTRLATNGPVSAVQLRDALAASSRAIFEMASHDRALQGMACVATIAAVDGERLRFGHVGDTRLFKIRGGAITKLTHDHSPVGELEDSGALSEVEAMRHPRRNEIYRDLGSQPPADDGQGVVETGDLPFERDAALVLCSDGLSDLVSSASVRRIVEAHAGAPALAVQELISAANDAGGKDNVTVLVVEGDGFAEAVATRGRRSPPRASQPAPAAPAVSPVSAVGMTSTAPVTAQPGGRDASSGRRRSGWALAALLAGIVAGAGAFGAGQFFGWIPAVPPRSGAATALAPRTWHVGLDGTADFPTIGAALKQAAAGDTVAIAAGEYREALVLPDGVSIVGSRQSVLRPPLGAPRDWAAVTARRVTHGRITGLLIASAADQPLGIGLVVDEASLEIDDIEITGATVAGVEFRAGARALFRRSFVHDNLGAGIIVRAQAEPRLEFNVILHNGLRPDAAAPGVLVEVGGRPVLTSNGIGGNGGAAVAGWPAAGLPELTRQNVLAPSPLAPPLAATPRRTLPRNRVP